MTVSVVGYQRCDFTDDNGKAVKGIKLRYAYQTKKRNYVGLEVASVWVPDRLLSVFGEPEINSFVDLDFEIDGEKSYLVDYNPVKE